MSLKWKFVLANFIVWLIDFTTLRWLAVICCGRGLLISSTCFSPLRGSEGDRRLYMQTALCNHVFSSIFMFIAKLLLDTSLILIIYKVLNIRQQNKQLLNCKGKITEGKITGDRQLGRFWSPTFSLESRHRSLRNADVERWDYASKIYFRWNRMLWLAETRHGQYVIFRIGPVVQITGFVSRFVCEGTKGI